MAPRSATWALMLGLILVSTSAPFIVQAQMPAVALVFWRTAFAAALFLVAAAVRGELRTLSGHARELAVGAVLLAAHFVLWVKAFELTTYASNLLLLVSQPIFAALLARLFLGERVSVRGAGAVVVALVGLLLIGGGDLSLGPRALIGDAMCLVGSAAIAGFYLATRRARAAMPLSPFMAATLAGCALLTGPFAIAGDAFLPASPAAWGWLAALVVLTTAAGHGLFNLAARHLRLFTINIVIVMEPAIAIAIGAALFGASVTALQFMGGLVLAVAVVLGLRA